MESSGYPGYEWPSYSPLEMWQAERMVAEAEVFDKELAAARRRKVNDENRFNRQLQAARERRQAREDPMNGQGETSVT